MDQFYIRLPSNSSKNIYPENRTSSYVTKLPDEIHLTGRWEIGLKEIQYPLSWFNIEEWVGNFTVDATNVTDIENDHKVVYGLKLPVGYYSSPTKLAEKITETCLVSMPYDLKECINVAFDVVTGKFTMRLLEGVSVQFHREFSRMTGFRRNIDFSQRSRGVCEIQRGVYSMYVYCDVCKENIVGDTKVPLLQIVPIRGDHGDYVCERYETPIYAPVQRNNISDIKIDITDDTGRRIPFQSGKTIVTLHLRKQGLHIQ